MCAVKRKIHRPCKIYVECSKAKNAGKLFDEYSMEGVDGESIEGMQPKKRRTRINYSGACTPRRRMGLRSADSENK